MGNGNALSSCGAFLSTFDFFLNLFVCHFIFEEADLQSQPDWFWCNFGQVI